MLISLISLLVVSLIIVMVIYLHFSGYQDFYRSIKKQELPFTAEDMAVSALQRRHSHPVSVVRHACVRLMCVCVVTFVSPVVSA